MQEWCRTRPKDSLDTVIIHIFLPPSVILSAFEKRPKRTDEARMTSIIRPEWSNFPISLFHGMSHFEVNSSFNTILATPVVLVQICRNIFFTFFHFSVIWNNFWPFVTPNNNNNKQYHLCCFLFFSSRFFIFRSFEFAACHSRRPTRRPILRSLGVARQPPVRLGEYTNWDKNDDFRHSCVISKSIEIGLGLNEVPHLTSKPVEWCENEENRIFTSFSIDRVRTDGIRVE